MEESILNLTLASLTGILNTPAPLICTVTGLLSVIGKPVIALALGTLTVARNKTITEKRTKTLPSPGGSRTDMGPVLGQKSICSLARQGQGLRLGWSQTWINIKPPAHIPKAFLNSWLDLIFD